MPRAARPPRRTGDGVAALVDALAAHAAAGGRRAARRRRRDAAVARRTPSAATAPLARATPSSAATAASSSSTPAPGTATLRDARRAQHLNFNGTCHGGAIFTLADSAFGLASNSHGVIAAGIDAHVAYHRPARLGERLEARAVEASRGSRVATYRVDVVRGSEPVASFTGTVYLSERARS